MADLTELLTAAQAGDKGAINRLLAFLYEDLRDLAHSRLRRSKRITLLNTTALVHESYLRLVRAGSLEVTSRRHFFAYAASTMRSIVVDHVRERQTQRRAGGAQFVTLEVDLLDADQAAENEIIRVNDALAELADVDERLVRVVEMRYFGGLTIEEIADSLNLTERTVRRDWQKARLLLRAALE